MKFFLSSKNLHKIQEFSRIFSKLGIDLISEKDLENALPEVEESGADFEGNALIKARAGADFTGLPTVADDSGLCVGALNGAPGMLSARFAGEHGNSKANNIKLLNELEGYSKSERTAEFVCVIACVFPDGREFTVRGECKGYIDFKESGKEGIGYDPLFISGKAIKKFESKIKEYL